jgi:hypothetical protein
MRADALVCSSTLLEQRRKLAGLPPKIKKLRERGYQSSKLSAAVPHHTPNNPTNLGVPPPT